MNDPWFDPAYAWLPGTVLGCTCGLIGGLAGFLVPQGKAKELILGAFYVMIVFSAVLLVAAIVGYFSGQPYGIWYGLGLAGLIGVLVMGANLPQVNRWYRQAEERRMKAHDLVN